MFPVDGFFYDAWFSHRVSLKTTGTNNNKPNANMADLAAGPGLVARKRG